MMLEGACPTEYEMISRVMEMTSAETIESLHKNEEVILKEFKERVDDYE